MSLSRQDLIGHLDRQLGFIRRSCASFDAGEREEAIRIGTAIRVLVHDTDRSTSLLKLLGVRDTIQLASGIPFQETVLEMPNGAKQLFGMHGGILRLSAKGPEYLPNLEVRGLRLLPVDQWWNQFLWVLGGRVRITRRDLVLAAANKDGGAHVDEPTEGYRALIEGPFSGGGIGFHGLPQGVEEPKQTSLVSLRELGHEILHSPDLTALAEGK